MSNLSRRSVGAPCESRNMSTVSKGSLGANDDNDDSVMVNVPQAGTLMMMNLMVVVMTMAITMVIMKMKTMTMMSRFVSKKVLYHICSLRDCTQ